MALGSDYFVSFGRNIAFPCRLVGYSGDQLLIEVPDKPRTNKSYLRLNGNLNQNTVSGYQVGIYDIGRTPEEAVINTAFNPTCAIDHNSGIAQNTILSTGTGDIRDFETGSNTTVLSVSHKATLNTFFITAQNSKLKII
jgi:hypothetical protein